MVRRQDEVRIAFCFGGGSRRRNPGALAALFVSSALAFAACTQPNPRDARRSPAAPIVPPPAGTTASLGLDLTDTSAVQIGDTLAPTIVAVGTMPKSDTTVGWFSSDTAVVKVRADGRLVAVGEGRTVLRATYAGLSTQTTVRVGATTFIGAGDIGVCQTPYAAATASILDTIRGRVFTAGDNTYPIGAASEWTDCWTPTWGRFRDRTIPALGNHDVAEDGGSAYFNYWGPRVGDFGKGYYSVNIGTWHVVVLNSETDVTTKSAQNQWLAADLQAAAATCTIAIWHRPRFSSSQDEPGDTAMAPLWRTLYAHHATIVLNGHAHDYERFAPQSPNAVPDSAGGIREFVVGTGGAMIFPFGTTAANSEVRQSATHGVLRLTLHAGSYDWQFIPILGDPPFADSGHGTCSH